MSRKKVTLGIITMISAPWLGSFLINNITGYDAASFLTGLFVFAAGILILIPFEKL